MGFLIFLYMGNAMLAELDGFYRVQQARYNELVVNAYMEIGRLAA